MNTLCPSCKKSHLSERRASRAAYAAPVVVYCPKCGYSALKKDREEKPIPPGSDAS